MHCLLKVISVCALATVPLVGCGDTSGAGGGGSGGTGGRGDGGTGGGAPPIIDEPGQCFEVFGPNGISHAAPRAHDLGVVELGDSREVSVRFYNFCSDSESIVVETVILDADGLSPSDDFAITRAPIAGASIGEEDFVEVTLSPTVAGWHRARIRYRVSHGYYDFDVVAEAVESGELPVPFEADCVEIGPSLTFAGGTVGQGMEQWLDVGLSCEAVLGATHVVLESYEFADNEDGAFELRDADAGRALVWGQPACGLECEESYFPSVRFTPPSEGAFEAVLTIVTNEPNGEHEVMLLGSTGD